MMVTITTFIIAIIIYYVYLPEILDSPNYLYITIGISLINVQVISIID